MLNLRERLPLLNAVFISGLVLLPCAVLATGAISQSYTAQTNLSAGTIVDQVSKGSSAVQPATNAGKDLALVGVTISQPLLQLSSNSQNGVQVALSGTAPTLVSDINGPVNMGDKITASPVAGVGMKARESGEIVGTAQAALSSVVLTSLTIKDHSGKNVSVKIGTVPVAISIQYFSASSASSLSAFIPSYLQDLANTISGKPVAPIRVLLSLVILLVGAVTAIIMLNAAIRNSIVSIGRNPLAGSALRRGLVDIILAAAGILLVTGVLVYGVLAG